MRTLLALGPVLRWAFICLLATLMIYRSLSDPAFLIWGGMAVSVAWGLHETG